MEKTINITVKDKIATAAKGAMYICGNSDFKAVFSFDAEWDAYDTKTARFKTNNGTYTDVIFSGNQCVVPIISNTNTVQIGVYAGNLSTTTPAFVMAKKSILCGAGAPADPTPDVYDQLMDKLNEIETPSHDKLLNRDAENQHPISAITGLEERLEELSGGSGGSSGVTSIGGLTGDLTLEDIGALPGKIVTYWPYSTSASNLFDILIAGTCGIVTGYSANSGAPEGMALPAFILCGSIDKWNRYFTVIDGEGKVYDGVADLRYNTVTSCELVTDARYAKAEDIQPGHMRVNVTTTDGETYTADKSFDEISAHIEAGGSASVDYNSIEVPFITGSSEYLGFETMIYEGALGVVIVWIGSDDAVKTMIMPLDADDLGAVPAPDKAEVGQVMVVKAVDDEGKPTEWEPTDLPSGGGSSVKTWTKLVDYSFDETNTISIIELTGLENLEEFYVKGVALTHAGTSESGYSLFINGTKLVESAQLLRIGKSGATTTGWATAEYNGIDWHILRSPMRTSSEDYIMSTALATGCVPSGVGAATSLKLHCTVTPTGGTLEVWGR